MRQIALMVDKPSMDNLVDDLDRTTAFERRIWKSLRDDIHS
jgi:hypothetical protein